MSFERKSQDGEKKVLVQDADRRTGGIIKSSWPIAAVFIVLILTVGFLLFTQNISAIPGKVAGWIHWGPDYHITRITSTAIGEIKKESKLVVMSTQITVYEKITSEKRVLWGKLNLGTTVVEMRVHGNKVQYVIATQAIRSDSFHWDAKENELVIEVPSPILDEEIIEVQSDPKRIEVHKDIGWARLESYSGKTLENQIRSNLRTLVIQQGKSELLLDKARSHAEATIRETVTKILQKEKQMNVPKMTIKFK